jgi:hypothetical protein
MYSIDGATTIPSILWTMFIGCLGNISTLEENLKNTLKKTIFRRKYYKDGLPNFQATLFFVAQKI